MRRFWDSFWDSLTWGVVLVVLCAVCYCLQQATYRPKNPPGWTEAVRTHATGNTVEEVIYYRFHENPEIIEGD